MSDPAPPGERPGPAGGAGSGPLTVPGDLSSRWREALLAAEFTHDRVVAALGPAAHAALGRNETTPALRQTTDRSPLSTLTRLFLLQRPVTREAADRALPGLVDPLADAGVLRTAGGEVLALLDCRPYATDVPGAAGDLWVVSDLTPGLDGTTPRVAGDHVLGVSAASTSLAQLTRRAPVPRALDLGTGCGVQALHLAAHAERVIATDVNPRALRLAGLTLALNTPALAGAVPWLREGSYFEPVAEERFDLITTNPPFVISPPGGAGGERLVYRDSGLPGDRVVEDIVRTAPDHLTPGGWCQVLANWVIEHGRSWDERLAGWLDPARTDAWVVQREVLDPARYVELWLADAGWQSRQDYTARYDAWLRWFEAEGVEAVGFGWINLRRRPEDAAGEGTLRLEEWPWEVEQPVGEQVGAFGRSVDALAGSGEGTTLLGQAYVLREDVRQETYSLPGAADPEVVVLRQQHGLRRARRVSTVLGAFLGACDGELTAGQIVDAVAQLLEADPSPARQEVADALPGLVLEGYLAPAG